MIVRLNSRTAMTVLSVGGLALTAVIFAVPVDATTAFGRCNARCQIGDSICFYECRCIYKNQCWSTTTNKLAARRRPVTGTGAPAPQPTHDDVRRRRER
jgi:hypothetical protein